MLFISDTSQLRQPSILHSALCLQLIEKRRAKVNLKYFIAASLHSHQQHCNKLKHFSFEFSHWSTCVLIRLFADISCRDGEHDCEDQTCIRKDLMCNRRENCRYGTDEHPDKCNVSQLRLWMWIQCKKQSYLKLKNISPLETQPKSMMQSEHIFIIMVVFVVMLTMIVVAFVFNCFRKIVRDHKMIRVSWRNWNFY